MSTLAVVIARAGSKGLALKNARIVGGKPMVQWTLEHALGSKRVDQVVLSTDGETIANVARPMGVPVIDRPTELANDHATVDAAVRDAVEQWARRTGAASEHIAILYGNLPVRPDDLTDRALGKLIETGCDSVQSVYPVGKMHPLWMRRLEGEAADQLTEYQPNTIYRRQDLPPVYMLNGGVIALTREALFTVTDGEPHAFLGTDRRAIVCEADDVVDVDNELDLLVAEAILSRRTARRESA